MNDVELARHIAETAGALLLTLQQSGLFEGKALGKASDRTANAFIMEAPATNRPEDAVLSEEEAADPARLSASRVWIVNPLDDTREYAKPHRLGGAYRAGHRRRAGDRRRGFAGPTANDLFANLPTPAAYSGRPRMLVSRTRPAAEAVLVAQALDAELIPMGSAGAKAMAILRG